MLDAGTDDFPAAFQKALRNFLEMKGMTQTQLANRIGISKARLNTYCGAKKPKKAPKKPARPEAEILYLLCVELGFTFEYQGYRVSAATLEGVPVLQPDNVAQQIPFDFERQFKLTNDAGELSVTVKRPGRIELSLSLGAAAS